jgi:hypothetical protein
VSTQHQPSPVEAATFTPMKLMLRRKSIITREGGCLRRPSVHELLEVYQSLVVKAFED